MVKLKGITDEPMQNLHAGERNISCFESVNVQGVDRTSLMLSSAHHILTTVASTTGMWCCLRTSIPGRCLHISCSNHCCQGLVSLGMKNISTTTADGKRVLQWLILSSLGRKKKGFVSQKRHHDIFMNLT